MSGYEDWTPEQDAAFRAAVDAGPHSDHGLSRNGGPPGGEGDNAIEYEFTSLDDFSARPYPSAEPLLGKPGMSYFAERTLAMVNGAEGSGKSTLTIDLIAHLASGCDWLEIPVPRPVPCLVIELEGPPGGFQGKLVNKWRTWDGPDFRENVHVYAAPWGDFSFADERARTALKNYCDEHGIEVVAANPTLGLGVAASGRPDETQQFVDWLCECGLWETRAYLLTHHLNKAGQTSGDWGRHPDTKIRLEQDGNRPRTKLVWEKVRWTTLSPEEHSMLLSWVPEAETYRVVPLEGVGASDEQIVERLIGFLHEHPLTATKHICAAVEGSDSRLTELLNGRPEFDFAKGPHGAKLWTLARSAGGPE